MFRKDLAAAMTARYGILEKDAMIIIGWIFREIAKVLAANESVTIRGFGEFYPCVHRTKRMVSVSTGKEKVMEPWRMVRFRPHGKLRALMRAK